VTAPAIETKARRAAALPPEERRSMIIAATLPLLLEHGDRVTSRQIAEAAGIAEGTIFRVFADKDELIAAAIDVALDQSRLEAALAAIPPDLDFEVTLQRAVTILQRRVVGVWRLMSNVGPQFSEMRRQPMADSDALVRLFDRYRSCISVTPIAAARLLRALTLSTTHPMLSHEAMSADDLVQLFLHGVGAPGAEGC
jgi:AcrR family transcriptional regulator